MTMLLDRKLYLLEPVFREKLSQDLCVLVNTNQPATSTCDENPTPHLPGKYITQITRKH
jgi:hypothetical protein